MCDNCLRQLRVNRQDVSAAAAAVVETLQSLPAADKRLTLTQLVDAWRKTQVLPLSHLLCCHICLHCLNPMSQTSLPVKVLVVIGCLLA